MAGEREKFINMPEYMRQADGTADRQARTMQEAFDAVKDPEVLEKRVNTNRGLELLPKVEAPKALATTEMGNNKPIGYNPVKPLTIADIFAQSRRELEKEKTDAAKMAKFQALGQLSQTLFNPIGWGAAGATADVKAPDQRGYIDAFNRMNKYDDQLAALGQQESQWNINEMMRQKQREESIADQQRITEANLRSKMSEMGMKFEYDRLLEDYKSGKNIEELIAKYGLEFKNAQQKHEWEVELKKIPTVHYSYSDSTRTSTKQEKDKQASRTVKGIGLDLRNPSNDMESDIKSIIDENKDDPEFAIEAIKKLYPDWAKSHGLIENDAEPGEYEDLTPDVPHAEKKKEPKTKKTADL